MPFILGLIAMFCFSVFMGYKESIIIGILVVAAVYIETNSDKVRSLLEEYF